MVLFFISLSSIDFRKWSMLLLGKLCQLIILMTARIVQEVGAASRIDPGHPPHNQSVSITAMRIGNPSGSY